MKTLNTELTLAEIKLLEVVRIAREQGVNVLLTYSDGSPFRKVLIVDTDKPGIVAPFVSEECPIPIEHQ